MSPSTRLSILALISFLSVSLLVGCRSHYIETTIVNQGPAAVHLVEFDYPSATFGKQTLDGHAEYHYRFKVQGSGAVKLEYTDGAGVVHTLPGPVLNEGEEGSLVISLGPDGKATWSKSLRPPG